MKHFILAILLLPAAGSYAQTIKHQKLLSDQPASTNNNAGQAKNEVKIKFASAIPSESITVSKPPAANSRKVNPQPLPTATDSSGKNPLVLPSDSPARN